MIYALLILVMRLCSFPVYVRPDLSCFIRLPSATADGVSVMIQQESTGGLILYHGLEVGTRDGIGARRFTVCFPPRDELLFTRIKPTSFRRDRCLASLESPINLSLIVCECSAPARTDPGRISGLFEC